MDETYWVVPPLANSVRVSSRTPQLGQSTTSLRASRECNGRATA